MDAPRPKRSWGPRAVAVVLAAATFALGFNLGKGADEERGELLSFGSGGGFETLQEAYDTIRGSSIDPPGEEELTRAAIKAMVKVLQRSDDPYALFYTPAGYRSFQEVTTGRFSGIGVWLKNRGPRLEIVSVLPQSPASREGLKRGDIIVRIDGEPAADTPVDEAVSLIKGPEGTDVTVGIKRGADDFDVTLTRATLELPNFQAHMTEDKIGYVRLFGFARGAGRQLRAKVEQFADMGAEGIVLDLRDNGGGLFSEAIEVASVFVEDGEIVSFEDRDDKVVYEAEGDAFEEMPLVVLVNGGTASASEIVAGAVQDLERGAIVGTKTYGKGSVQEVFPLLDASAVKITTGAYITPDGHQLNGTGITPDVVVDADPAVQRERAMEVLTRSR